MIDFYLKTLCPRANAREEQGTPVCKLTVKKRFVNGRMLILFVGGDVLDAPMNETIFTAKCHVCNGASRTSPPTNAPFISLSTP